MLQKVDTSTTVNGLALREIPGISLQGPLRDIDTSSSTTVDDLSKFPSISLLGTLKLLHKVDTHQPLLMMIDTSSLTTVDNHSESRTSKFGTGTST